MEKKRKVLSFGDTVLTELELEYLQPGQWLNDNIIHFYFDWLTEKWKRPANLLLVCPSTMFLIQMTDDTSVLADILEPLKLKTREIVCMPINNNSDVGKVGGSHWCATKNSMCEIFSRQTRSFLVYSQKIGFRHFDSSGGMNNRSATRTAKAMAGLVGAKGNNVVVVPCPQQANSSDCGVFTLAFAEAFGSAFISSGDETGNALQHLTQPAVSAMRRSIADLIQKLAAESAAKTK